MASWLSFWNQRRRAANSAHTGERLDSAWIPWSEGKLNRGDTVFAVGIEDGRLKLRGWWLRLRGHLTRPNR
jgi:hypothetical protein